IPGDPARIALGPNATAEQVASLREKLYLDRSLAVQYGYFVNDLVHGDLGVSLYTNHPVTTDIAQFLPATLELIFVAGLMMVGFGLPLGVLSARYRNSWVDNVVRLVTLMLLFAFYLPLFPIAGRISDTITVPPVTNFLFIDTLLARNPAAFANAVWHVLLPAFALALAGIGQAARLTRSNMAETYDRPFIEMARSYGFPEWKIANHYAFRPSMIPSLTIIGLDFAAMLGNAFLVEAVFAWPGLSRYGVAVILRKDLNA